MLGNSYPARTATLCRALAQAMAARRKISEAVRLSATQMNACIAHFFLPCDTSLSKTTPPVQRPDHTETLTHQLEVSHVLDRNSWLELLVNADQAWARVCHGKHPDLCGQTADIRHLRRPADRSLVLVPQEKRRLCRQELTRHRVWFCSSNDTQGWHSTMQPWQALKEGKRTTWPKASTTPLRTGCHRYSSS